MKIDLLLLGGMGFLGVIAALAFIIPLLKTSYRYKKTISLLTVLVLSLCTGSLYYSWGAYRPWTDKLALEVITTTLEQLHQTPKLNRLKIIEAFEQCEKDIAYSSVALARLGEIYSELGLLEQSRDSWDKVIALAPDNKAYQVPWLYSHMIINEGKLPEKVREKAETWAQSSSFERPLLNILAMDDYFQKRYDRAIQAWTLLLAMDKELPLERQKVLQNAIAMAMLKKQNKE
jgi:cytochrome c-type biogenesis protein CcmH/NrfG